MDNTIHMFGNVSDGNGQLMPDRTNGSEPCV